MKYGKTKMATGKLRKFKNGKARDKFEKFAQALKGGWHPTGKRKTK